MVFGCGPSVGKDRFVAIVYCGLSKSLYIDFRVRDLVSVFGAAGEITYLLVNKSGESVETSLVPTSFVK